MSPLFTVSIFIFTLYCGLPGVVGLEMSVPFVWRHFTCESIDCSKHTLPYDMHFHTVAGFDHPSAFPLFVFRLCEALQKCIKPANMRLVLHATLFEDESLNEAKTLLDQEHVPYTVWSNETFTSNAKMKQSFESLKDVTSPDAFIYQTDVDEFPEYTSFTAALEELRQGHCNAIRAQWRDRLSQHGKLARVLLPSSNATLPFATLASQFPLRCKVSELFVGGGKTSKTLIYQANYRLDGGHHEIWCDRAGNLTRSIFDRRTHKTVVKVVGASEERHVACIDHIRERSKGPIGRYMLSALPKQEGRPTYCKNEVILDHYKFTYGLYEHLQQRYRTFFAKKVPWWRDSARIIQHLDAHNNSVCVACEMSKCKVASTGRRSPIDRNIRFHAQSLLFDGKFLRPPLVEHHMS